MIYSDKLDIGYLIPINFFKLYDQIRSNYNLFGGSNNQIFGQISTRNLLKNTHAYISVFIDEIRLGKVFSKIDNRNQVAYTIGINKTDLFTNYFTLGCEYTKVRGGVYNNVIPAQTYTNNSFVLGDWIGQNADRFYLFAKYTPFAKFKVKGWYQYARKGTPYTIDEQYNQQPEPPFLNKKLFNQQQLGLTLNYEWIHTLKSYLNIVNTKFEYPAGSNSNLLLQVGFSYGL